MTLRGFEEWRDIPGYEGFYEVSDLGRVRSVGRQALLFGRLPRYKPPSVRATPVGHTGYPSLNLFRGTAVAKKWKVHQLVLLAFVGPRPPGLIGLHKDGVKTHCALVNLRYGTHAENAQDRERHGQGGWAGHVSTNPRFQYMKEYHARERELIRAATSRT